jgi:hypothetical protein
MYGQRYCKRVKGLDRGLTFEEPRAMGATSVGGLFEAARTSGLGRRGLGDPRVQRERNEGNDSEEARRGAIR